MAKKEIKEQAETKPKKDISKYMKSAGAVSLRLADNSVTQWIDTGSYTLNGLISGSLFKGIPAGRTTLFFGESSVGKTLFLAKILGNAQRMGITPFVVDTEHAFDKEMAESCGMDLDDVIYNECIYIEEIKNLVAKFLNSVIENGDFGKFIVAIDSLACPSVKELNDVDKNSESQDMGMRAKALAGLFRVLNPLAAKAKCSIVCTNQVYDNPGELHKSILLIPSGGKKQIYMSTVAIQLRKTLERADDSLDDSDKSAMTKVSKNVTGIKITGLCIKNRLIIPFGEMEIYLNFKTGLNKWGGLWELAIKQGVLISKGKTYAWGDDPKQDSLGYKKALIKDIKFWNTLIEKLDPILQADTKFSNQVSEEVDALLESVADDVEDDGDDIDETA